ncbi:unnamed protein product (macronuclear) [Paramecium tetraurelia]|uniref:Transmembrane protein n=1 Tax=Paramecium tetraurelia TaxID=5888 RepID=A0D7S8_PARTE|nr:uncharacterized protein GSPATT00014062001 [Paramecium tetraurelia]CAK79095.1 unnamed protein product [Paramecium tetraurelia]|eukprot:XP_001446492.1 hypothetical protein (macronuclear) [Paramecium tetraurelia strain d4-2]
MVISINNAVNRFLLGIDIFGQSFTINVNGKRNYTTACGGITSVLVIAIVIMSSWNTIINFFWKSNLQVSISSEHNMDSPIIKLDSDNFMLTMGLKQLDNTQLQYFQIEIEQRLYNNNSEQISYIELEKCSNERLLQLQENQTINMAQVLPQEFQGSLLCLKNNQTLHFHQSGPNQLEFLRINIKKCKNFTNSQLRCASEDEINQFVQKNRQFTLQLYFANYILNPHNTGENYVQQFLDDSVTISFIPQKLLRSVTLLLKKYNLMNDDSVMPSNEKSEVNLISSQDKIEIVDLGRDDDEVYGYIDIKQDIFTTTIKRSCLKLHTLLSYIGGLLQALSLVLGSLIIQYNKLQMSLDLANQIFQFEKNSEVKIEQIKQLKEINNVIEQQKEQSRTEKSPQSQRQLHKSQVDSPYCGREVNKLFFNILRSQFEFQTNSERKIQLNQRNRIISKQFNFEKNNTKWVQKFGYTSSKDYFRKSIIGILTRYSPLILNFKFLINQITFGKLFQCNDSKLLEIALKKINMLSDSKYLFEKLTEIDKLKQILLTKDQLAIFNFTSKPIISLKIKNRRASKNSLYKQYNQYIQNKQNLIDDIVYNYEQVLSVYEKIESTKNMYPDNHYQTHIIRRLIKQIDPELLTIYRLQKYIESQEVIEQLSEVEQQQNSVNCLISDEV